MFPTQARRLQTAGPGETGPSPGVFARPRGVRDTTARQTLPEGLPIVQHVSALTGGAATSSNCAT